MKRPMKTFDVDDSIIDLLRKASALLTKVTGKHIPEGEVIRRALRDHAASDALREGARILEEKIAVLPEEGRQEAEERLRREYEVKRQDLLATCVTYGIPVDESGRG